MRKQWEDSVQQESDTAMNGAPERRSIRCGDALEICDATLVRWRDAAARLGLGTVATMAGAVVLTTELTNGVNDELRGPMTRSRLLQSLEQSFSKSQAYAGLLELEASRACLALASPLPGWNDGVVEINPAVRMYCAGLHPAQLLIPTPGAQLSVRLRSAIEDVAAIAERTSALVLVRGGSGTGRDSVLSELLARLGRDGIVQTPIDLRCGDNSLEPRLSGAVGIWAA